VTRVRAESKVPDRRPFLYLGTTPFIRAFLVSALLVIAGVRSCVARQLSHERSALKRYNEVVQDLADVLRVGYPKEDVLQTLQRRNLAFTVWEDSEPNGSSVVGIRIAEWSSFPFDHRLTLALTFGRGHLIGWGPWR